MVQRILQTMAKLDATAQKPQNRYRVKYITQIHVVVLIICSIAIFMLGLIAVLSTTYAQTSTPSNATTAESHTTNTTGTPFNATASSLSSSPCLAKDTTIIVDVYSGMTRTMHFKANQ